MPNRHFFCIFIAVLVLSPFGVGDLRAQTQAPASQQSSSRPGAAPAPERVPAPPVANDTEMNCAGFIEYRPAPAQLQVAGSEQEQEQHVFAEGDYIYINGGRDQGVRLDQEFTIVRPRGRFDSKFTDKKGTLGIYTQEVGRLRVAEVKDRVSIAVISNSCETILLGDLLRPAPLRTAPRSRTETALDRFADSRGKQTGRIVLARDGREMVSSNQIVFVDLGAEDNVKSGDYLTIYRPVGTPRVIRSGDREISRGASSGFESETFRGGKFSNKAQRVKDPTGERAHNHPITSPEIKNTRPALPRKIVGEGVILNVQQRTAAVMITRVAQEVFTGDYVEVQ